MTVSALTRDIVELRSNGSCEICGYWCPPILQFHHVVPTNRGGEDYPFNVACICPNCHATIHSHARGNEMQLIKVASWIECIMPEKAATLLIEFICGKPTLKNGKWEYE